MPEECSIPLSRLSPEPVQGRCMHNVHLLRLDQLGGSAPGNKSFKLHYNLDQARASGVRRVLSFGGAWSNHLHALAAVGHELGLETIGIIRGGEVETAAMADARAWGMTLVPVSREQYRRRHDKVWWRELAQRYAPCLVIPEGGGNAAGVRGCLQIAALIERSKRDFSRVVTAVGTGTTLAGLAAGLPPGTELVGISALKGAKDLERRVETALSDAGLCARARWRIIHDYHCGGFARTHDELRQFMLAFEATQKIALEPVYTGKMMYAIHCQLARQQWSANESILAIHSGGLQGRRGYAWLP